MESSSSSDWSPTSSQQRYIPQWERWGEENLDRDQVHNPIRNPTPSPSLSDWSRGSSGNRCNHRWEQWEMEDPARHIGHPTVDEDHLTLRDPEPSAASSDWSGFSSEQRLNQQWEHWDVESIDSDMGNHLGGDEDYCPPKNSRVLPSLSSYKPIAGENSTQPQRQTTQRIGMSESPYAWLPQTLIASIIFSIPSSKS